MNDIHDAKICRENAVIEVFNEKESDVTFYGCENMEQDVKNNILADQNRRIQDLTEELQKYKKQCEELEWYKDQFDNIVVSKSWRLTAPLRLTTKIIKILRRDGIASLAHRILFSFKWRKENKRYEELTFTEKKLSAQRRKKFFKKVKFSILVPLYNTPEIFLHEMIQSVLNQTYGNWELCLADGSDAEHGVVETICREYAHKDSRILYRKLEKNLGISGNSNACLEMATGQYIALFDHDDLLHPAALYEMMTVICRKGADFIYTDEDKFHISPDDAFYPHHKPDYAPDTLRSNNYICHFTAFDAKLLMKVGGGFNPSFDGSQDYDLILRLTEQARKIVHIPKILYYWRSHEGSVASGVTVKAYALDAGKRVLEEHLKRIGLKGKVMNSKVPSTYKIQYEIDGNPLISILIPTKDHIGDLKKCIDSIQEKSTYQNWEIIIIENNSIDEDTFAYYQEVVKDERIRVVVWEGEFNYSAINNFGARSAKGEYILLLNNDIEVITPDWLEQMLMFAQRKDVGAVGAMLYYPDDTVQHAGVIVGLWGGAGHSHKYYTKESAGYMGRMTYAQNYSCVTAACLMMRRTIWDEINGLNEDYKVAFNDVDMCMRVRKAGYLIVWTPYAEMYHHESKSRGADDTQEKQKRAMEEVQRFRKHWKKELLKGDPYYNLNLTLEREDFSLRESLGRGE